MSSITNLDELFNLAAVDWSGPPTPPTGTSKSPKLASKTISVQVAIEVTSQGPPLGEWLGLVLSGTLFYTPGTVVRAGGLVHRLPASFAGTASTSGASFFMSIAASSPEYGVFIDAGTTGAPPVGATFDLSSPGGAQGTYNDPLVDIGLESGSVAVTGGAASFQVSLHQYSFLVTLSKAG
jgi:hypothetical protein